MPTEDAQLQPLTETEPARLVALAVGVLTAAYAALGVVVAGGDWKGAALAGIGALITALGGGEIVRKNVEPVKIAQERRDYATAQARGAEIKPGPDATAR